MNFSFFEDRDLLRNKLGGPVQIFGFTSETSATAIVPSAGNHLRVFQIIVSASNPSNVGDITISDG